MKVPFSWLKDYVEIDCTAEELETKLFSCGFEVEEMIYVGKNIDKIVTCKILEIEKHPNADKLSVTQIDAGEYGKLQIITAATNIFVGALVPVALNGATLASGDKIKTGNLRGLPSYGMFCSGEELGIDDDWYEGASVNGILILKEDYPLGASIKELLDLEDVIFDINVTANRPDCQSILGIAREVSAVLGKPLKAPDLSFESCAFSTTETVKVENSATDLCPRYISHYVKDVKIENSPAWLKRRLSRMGIRSINNVVDITNFVLLEIGQPMHAFDLNDLSGNEIIVRRALDGEKIVTLDEKEFSLNSDNLVICDAEKPVAIAGIMGGLNSEIKGTTKEILFESAKFARDNIRKTSRTLGQRTDASSRYEKGVDAYTTEIGMKRALHLINKLGFGKIAADCYDLCSVSLNEKVIDTTIEKVNGVLGITVPTDTIKNILEKLNFKVNIDGDKLSVTVPLYREDVDDYPDIAEEIIREYGYDHIQPSLLKTSAITNGGRNENQTIVENLKNLLVGYGFNEIITYSFVSEKEYDLFDIEKNDETLIKILNPIGEDMSVMRMSLLPSIVRAVCYNLNRKNFDGRLFEFAKVYNADKIPLEKLPKESNVLSVALFGTEEDFFTAKGVIQGILDNFCNGVEVSYLPCDLKRMHPTRSANVFIGDKNIGYFGQLNPILCDKLDIDKPVFVGEIYYDVLREFFVSKIIFKPISKFPSVERDIAFIIDDTVSCAEVTKCIKQSAGKHLESLKLFDIYKGAQIGDGKKSMAFNLLFVSNERTLNVEEIDGTVKKILNRLKENFDAELR